MINLRNVLVFVGILGALGTGCVIDVSSRGAYDSCSAGDTCSFGTICQASGVVVSGRAQGSLCTETCTPGISTCSAGGETGVCVLTSAGTSQCFRSCSGPGSVLCGSGASCVAAGSSATGSLYVCVPTPGTGTTVTCGASGQSCCAGSVCNSGLACGTGNICGTPCGLSGQSCCPGSTCTTGLSCGMNGLCGSTTRPATAYVSCTPAGSTCTDGTTCIQALAQSPTTPVGNTCTAICSSGAASMCPGYVPGQVECVNLTGNPSMFQCVRLCNAASDCAPYNTQCLSVVSGGGSTIRICAP